MININNYILEKLHISKEYDAAKNTAEYYFTVDIHDIDSTIREKDIQKWVEDYHISDWYRNIPKKIKDNNGKNRLWYAIYCYLLDFGPAKWQDIIQTLKPGSPTKYSELAADMVSLNIIKNGRGKERGLKIPNHPYDWLRYNPFN